MAKKIDINNAITSATKSETFERAEKSKGGRPFKKEEEKTKIRVQVYFNEIEMKEIEEKAKMMGLTPGIWVKSAALKETRRKD